MLNASNYEEYDAKEVAVQILDCFYQFYNKDGNIDTHLYNKIQELRHLVKANPGLALQVKQYIYKHFADRINQLCDQYEL